MLGPQDWIKDLGDRNEPKDVMQPRVDLVPASRQIVHREEQEM